MSDKHDFAYSGPKGPEFWEGTCHDGTHQSPIDLPGDVFDGGRSVPHFEYGPVTLTATNNGHTIQYDVDEHEVAAGANRLTFNDVPFDLLQFHFHVHSEHRLDGTYLLMEMHLVHKSPSESSGFKRDPDNIGHARMGRLGIWDRYIVVAFLLDVIEDEFQALWHEGGPLAWPQAANLADGTSLEEPLHFDMRQFLERAPDLTMLHYHGSTTTPPCIEVVDWFVVHHPVGITPEAVHHFPHSGNFRPIQDTSGRRVELLAP